MEPIISTKHGKIVPVSPGWLLVSQSLRKSYLAMVLIVAKTLSYWFVEVVFEVPGSHFCADQCVLQLQHVPVSPLWDSFVVHVNHLPTPTKALSHPNPFIFSVQESTKDKCLSSCGAPLWFAVAHLPTPTHPPSHPIPCVSPVHESTIAHV